MLLVLESSGSHLLAQENSSIDSIPQKDFFDVVSRYIKLSKKTSEDPNKPQFSAIPAAGYSMHTGWAGIVTANLAFYASKEISNEKKFSTLATNVTYSQFKQVMIPVQVNIWTKNNKFNLMSDLRYIKYPSKVFGLGTFSKTASGYLVDYQGLKLHQTVLMSFAKNMYAGIGYFFDRFWNVREVDPPVGTVTSFQSYGLEKKSTSAGPVVKLLYDSRLNTINPQNGFHANITYRPSFSSFGSDNNWQSLQIDLRKYIRFPSNSNNILAIWSNTWLTTGGKPPFLMLPSTGWDDSYNTGRGYIQGRFREANMVYLESEYRFQISPSGLIGGVMFVNGQSFSPSSFKGYKTVVPGMGVGLRIKLNKYSGANVCIDYGFGRDGSRGFAVNLGELF